jgi:hypothetical protein
MIMKNGLFDQEMYTISTHFQTKCILTTDMGHGNIPYESNLPDRSHPNLGKAPSKSKDEQSKSDS